MSIRIACRLIVLTVALTCLPAGSGLALAAGQPDPSGQPLAARLPVVHYTFAGASATNVQTPGKYDGALGGGASISGGVLSLNGTSAYLETDGGAAIDFSHGVRVAARVKRMTNVDEDAVVGKWGWNTDQWLLTFYPDGSGSLRFGVRFSDGTGAEVRYSPPDTSYLGLWVDVEASYAPSEGLALSWNGIVVARDRSVAGRAIAEGPQSIHVGEAGTWMDWTRFAGEIDEAKIWNNLGERIDLCSADYLTPRRGNRWKINYEALNRDFPAIVVALAQNEGEGYAIVNAGGAHDPLTLDFSECPGRIVLPGRNTVNKVAIPNLSSYTKPKYGTPTARPVPQSSVFPFDSAVVGLFTKGEVVIDAADITFVGDGVDRVAHGVPSWYSASNLIADPARPVETLHIQGAEGKPVSLTHVRDYRVNHCLWVNDPSRPLSCDDPDFGGEEALECRVESPGSSGEAFCNSAYPGAIGTVIPLGSAAPTVVGTENVGLDITDFVIDAYPGSLPSSSSDVMWSYARGITLIYTYYNADGEGRGNVLSPRIGLTARSGRIVNVPWDSITSSGPVDLRIEDCSITQHAAFQSRRGAAIGPNRNHPKSNVWVIASDGQQVDVIADKGIWNAIEQDLYKDVARDLEPHVKPHLTIQGDVRLRTGQWSLQHGDNPVIDLQHASDPDVGPVVVLDTDLRPSGDHEPYATCGGMSEGYWWNEAKVNATQTSHVTGSNLRFVTRATPPARGFGWVKLVKVDIGSVAENFVEFFQKALAVDHFEIIHEAHTGFVVDLPTLAEKVATWLQPRMVVRSALLSYDLDTDSVYVSIYSDSHALHYFYGDARGTQPTGKPIDLCTSAPAGYVPAGARDYTVTVGDLTFHFDWSRDEGIVSVSPLSAVNHGTTGLRLLERGWDIRSTLPANTFDVEVAFPYTDGDVARLGVDEARLRPFHSQRRGWAPWVWQEARLVGQDALLNTVTARTSHFSRWTLGAWPLPRHWPHR